MNARFLVAPLTAAIVTLPGIAYASSMVVQPGSLLTTGPSPNYSTGFSSLYNPAAGEIAIGEEDTVRWGYISSFGFQVEIGNFDNFDTEIEDLIDDLDQDDLSIDDAQDIIDRYEAIREPFAEEGYFKSSTHLSVPVTPLSLRLDSIDGVLTFNSRAGVDIRGSFLDDDIAFLDLDGDTNGELVTNSAVYIKGSEMIHFGASYATELNVKEASFLGDAFANMPGKLFGGVTLNYYQFKLSKQIIALNSVDEDEELSDIISDNYEDNQESTGNVSLDLGLMWEGENFSAGFAWRNINEPEFDYGTVGVDCAPDDDNCGTAAFFSDRIDLNETYVLNSQASVSGSMRTDNKMFELYASADLNEVRDPIGDEFQWFTVSGSFNAVSWARFRVGYATNLAGSELDTLNAGMSLGAFNLDLRYGLDSVSYDDSDIPRTVAINIGLESQF